MNERENVAYGDVWKSGILRLRILDVLGVDWIAGVSDEDDGELPDEYGCARQHARQPDGKGDVRLGSEDARNAAYGRCLAEVPSLGGDRRQHGGNRRERSACYGDNGTRASLDIRM